MGASAKLASPEIMDVSPDWTELNQLKRFVVHFLPLPLFRIRILLRGGEDWEIGGQELGDKVWV